MELSLLQLFNVIFGMCTQNSQVTNPEILKIWFHAACIVL